MHKVGGGKFLPRPYELEQIDERLESDMLIGLPCQPAVIVSRDQHNQFNQAYHHSLQLLYRLDGIRHAAQKTHSFQPIKILLLDEGANEAAVVVLLGGLLCEICVLKMIDPVLAGISGRGQRVRAGRRNVVDGEPGGDQTVHVAVECSPHCLDRCQEYGAVLVRDPAR